MVTLKKFVELDNERILEIKANKDVPEQFRNKVRPADECSYENLFVKQVEYQDISIGCGHASACDCPTETKIELQLWTESDRSPGTYERIGAITNQWDTNPLEKFEVK